MHGVLVLILLFAFRSLGTTVFTEPAVPQIEEVGRLVHVSDSDHLDSIKRTGTDIRRPFRQICTCTVSPI